MERAAEAIQGLAPENQALTHLFPERECREYCVCFDGRQWNVATCDGEAGPSSLDRSMAITLAIRAARHDCGDGLDATVSVEEQDGTFTLAWASA
jgi:hypothetical protein